MGLGTHKEFSAHGLSVFLLP